MSVAEYLIISDTSPTGLVWAKSPHARFKVGAPALTSVGKNGYFKGQVCGVDYTAHRVVFFLTHGHWPSMVDHIDGNRLNNDPTNLREVSRAENQQNVRHCGAHKSRQRWRACLKVNGKHVHLGMADSQEEAHALYLQGKRMHHTVASEHCYDSP